MDTELDLSTTNREALLAIITQQQGTIAGQQTTIAQHQVTIAQLLERIVSLETGLNNRGGGGMPGSKPSSTRRASKKVSRKRRPHGFARKRMSPTQQVEHALEACPECGNGLSGGWVQRTREVIEVPLQPVQVIQSA